ncbi:GerMN domain-containing protein [Pseudobutyrivibrio sp.]|uniref:GerMN domain-containing protein n=1 Tax=Pseudobutyrivibrio sp. TaxID=2014367 RepID=UPI0025F5A018|nr:GerMN domain-containing protein [Pseudobutyrivibrio sp.]MBR5650431.1 GerMN domain-containing protein [Pseudobutyrivibrio sp.]
MKRIVSTILIICILFTLGACGHKDKSSQYKIYYVNTDKNGLTPVDYKYKSSDDADRISEALKALAKKTDSVDYMAAIPAGVDVDRWELDDQSLSLYLTGDYESLDVYTEILVRAAIVKTLTLIDGVESVSLFINDKPFTDASGEILGAMTSDTFIDDFGQETDSLLSTELTLYFASADGLSLVPETRQVYYSRNLSPEKLIIEQLLNGPDSSELLASLPADTKLNSISISENGVCIVNFDATFETAISNVTENVTVYSIVNSLTEVDSIKQVQILVNGDVPHLSNLEVDISAAISRNEDIINNNINGGFSTEDDTDYTYDYMDYSDYVDEETPEGEESDGEPSAENPDEASTN